MNLKAFSLIELLVVVAIIAILSSIAVSIYTQYAVKARIGSGIALLSSAITAAQQQYIKGTLASVGFVFNGTNYGSTDTALACNNCGPINRLWVSYKNPDFSNADNVVMLCGLFTGLNITGFQNDGLDFANAQLCMGFIDNNGTFATYCGYTGRFGSSWNIPSQYLPINCNNNLDTKL